MIKLLSTKKLDDRAIADARSLNMGLACVEFIKVSPIEWNGNLFKEDNYRDVVFTSSNAVKYFLANPRSSDWLKNKIIYAISGKTSEELIGNDIRVSEVAENSFRLAHCILRTGTEETILHICGDKTSGVLKGELEKANVKYESLVVYNTDLLANFRVSDKYDAILFFSPSGVDVFLSANSIDEEILCCCVGEATAQHLKDKSGHKKIITSSFPSPHAMFQATADYFK